MAGEAELERILVRLLGDASQYEKTLKRGIAATVSFAKKVNAKLQSVANGMRRLGRTMALRVTAPLLALGIASVAVGANFEKGFIGVRKTVDATESQLADLRSGFKAMALEVPVAVEELLKIGESAGQLGIATDNVLGFTETIAALGVATNLTTDDAATSLARFANITGLSQRMFSNLGSSIVALGNSTATTESEIASMSLRIAGAGSVVGLTDSQIVAFAASLSSVGLAAEAGGTAFSKLVLQLQTAVALGGKELQSFARVAGKSAGEFAAAFRGDPSEAILDLLQGLGSLDKEARVLALTELGFTDVRMVRTILASSSAVGKFIDNLNLSEQAFEDNVALANEAAEAYKSFWSQLTLLKNQGKDLLEKVFVVMRPTLTAMIDSVKALVKWFGNLSPEILKVIVIGGAILAVVGPVLLGLAGLFGTLGFAIIGLAATFAFLMSPVGLTLTAIVAIGSAVIVAGAAILKFTSGGQKALRAFARVWGELLDHIRPAIQGIKDALSAGDFHLAFQIGAIQIQLSFSQLIKKLLTLWGDLTVQLKTLWADTAAFIADKAIKVAFEIEKAKPFRSEQERQFLNAGKNLALLGVEAVRKDTIEKATKAATDALVPIDMVIGGLTLGRDALVTSAAVKAAGMETDALGAGPGSVIGNLPGGRPGGPRPMLDRRPDGPIQAAQVGTAEAASRIAAFRAGAGPSSDAEETANNTGRIVEILEEMLNDDSPLTVSDLGFGGGGLRG